MTSSAVHSVCVLGLGYVGLPTAAVLARAGLQVLGVDVRPDIVERLSRGDVHIHEPGLNVLVKAVVETGRLKVATAPRPADVFIIAVPTPIQADKTSDLSMVRSASAMIGPVLKKGDLVILESTSPAGTTTEVMCPVLEELSGLKAGVDFHACYCPERVMPGRTIEELEQNDRVVGGVTPECARRAVALYHTFVKGGVHATTAATAEMCKLMENSYRDVNVAFANEVARLCEAEGVDVYEAIRLSNLHPRVNILKPGPGVGGHCIPVDPWFMVERQPSVARLITTARETNDATPVYLARAMERRFGLAPGARVAVLGVAYRANIDDARETPAESFIADLAERGYDVRCWDPLVHQFSHPLSASLADAIEGADAVAILVGHNEIVAALDPTWWATVVAEKRVFDAADVIPDRGVWAEHGFDVAGVGRMAHEAAAWEEAARATPIRTGGH